MQTELAQPGQTTEPVSARSEIPESERRRAPRVEIYAQIKVADASTDYIMNVVNMSRSGILVDMGKGPRPRWLKLETDIDLNIFLPETGAAVDIAGNIVRYNEDLRSKSFAARFIHLTPEVGAKLEHLMEVGCAKPPPLPGG